MKGACRWCETCPGWHSLQESDPQAVLATMPAGVATGLPDKPWLHEDHHSITSATVGVAEQTAQTPPQFFHTLRCMRV